MRDTVHQLLKDYKGDIKVVYKNLIVHPGSATIPAQAGCAAHLQGKFAEMEDLIWKKGYQDGRNLSKDRMDELAKEVGLDMAKFDKDMSGECVKIVQSDANDMRRLGARGTPAFFINGRFLSGARPIDQFKTVIDEELKKANDRISKGTKLQDYYKTWVLDKGKKSL